MAQEEFLLKWNDHHTSFFHIVEELCRTEQLCDVTLACGGQVFETHKLILSVCSPYFRTLLGSHRAGGRMGADKHPIVYLKDVNPQHLEQLLSYMYRGEINVLQNDLGPLIETARGLQIKGLADAGGGDGGGSGGSNNSSVSGGSVVANASSAAGQLVRAADKKVENGGITQKSLLKRTKVVSPAAGSAIAATQPQAKVPKLDAKPKKSMELCLPDASKPSEAESNVVKLEEDDGSWQEDSIPNETYEQDLTKDYEQDLSKTYEQELQLEDEQYIQPEGLSGHQIRMLQKEIQKKYSCEFCHKRFPTPSKLNRHTLVHSGEKPYHCVLCNKGFTQKVHLNTHKKLAHPGTVTAAELQYVGHLELEDQQTKFGVSCNATASTPPLLHVVEDGAGNMMIEEEEQNGYDGGSDSENQLYINTDIVE